MPLYLGHNLVSGQTRPVETELREGSKNLATIEAIRNYVAQKISEIPTPDVSGQIEQHNVDSEAHSDIRAAITLAKTETTQLIDTKIAAIPTPDVSGQINEHNTSEEAHTDIRRLIDTKIAAISTDIFSAGASAPTNTKLLWIDTNATTGGLKYYNGSAWVHVPVAYT